MTMTRRQFATLATLGVVGFPLTLAAIHTGGTGGTALPGTLETRTFGLMTSDDPRARAVAAVTVDGVWFPARDCMAADDRGGWLVRMVRSDGAGLVEHGGEAAHGDNWGPDGQPKPFCPECQRRRRTGSLHYAVETGHVVIHAENDPSPHVAVENELRVVPGERFVDHIPTGRMRLLVDGRIVTRSAFLSATRCLTAWPGMPQRERDSLTAWVHHYSGLPESTFLTA